MSKKIKIHLGGRGDLISLFHSYLSSNPIKSSSYYDDEDEWYRLYEMLGSDEWDDGSTVNPFYNKKVNKKGSKKHKDDSDVYSKYWEKQYRKHQLAYGYADDDDFDDFDGGNYMLSHRRIWFYVDYHNKYDRLEFNSLKEFSEYCDSMGYYLPDCVLTTMSFRDESHCCICPESERMGLLEILGERSYGDMYYEACKDNEI